MGKLIFLFLLLAATSASARDFDGCRSMFAENALPEARFGGSVSLCFDGFAVLYSTWAKAPIYAAEKLTRERVAEAAKQEFEGAPYEESRLPEADRAVLDDFHQAGYARTLLAPVEDMPDEHAAAQSLSLANALLVDKNAKKQFGEMEERVRRIAAGAAGNVYVLTGGAYLHPPHSRGRTGPPQWLWKLVYDEGRQQIRGFWMANTKDAHVGVVSYSELIAKLGYELLPGVEVK